MKFPLKPNQKINDFISSSLKHTSNFSSSNNVQQLLEPAAVALTSYLINYRGERECYMSYNLQEPDEHFRRWFFSAKQHYLMQLTLLYQEANFFADILAKFAAPASHVRKAHNNWMYCIVLMFPSLSHMLLRTHVSVDSKTKQVICE